MNKPSNKFSNFSSFLGLINFINLKNNGIKTKFLLSQCCSPIVYTHQSSLFSTFRSTNSSVLENTMTIDQNNENNINNIGHKINSTSNSPCNIISISNSNSNSNSPTKNESKITETIDDLPILNLFGLRLKFDGIKFFVMDFDYTLSDLIQISNNLHDSFVNINKKGYVSEKFTLIPFFTLIKDFIKSMNYKVPFDFGMNENTFTLWFNVIKANLVMIINNVLDNTTTTDEFELDLIADIEVIRDELISDLDPFIRVQIQKRGITMISNTYTGFDTEYKLKNLSNNINSLISVQTAVQNRVLIKLPLYNSYDISYVHPLTSEITRYFKPKVDDWRGVDEARKGFIYEMSVLNESLKHCVESLRHNKFLNHDTFMLSMIEKLKSVENVSYFEDLRKDHIVFALPLSDLNSSISYPSDELGYSMQDLVNNSNSLVHYSLINTLHSVVQKFSDLVSHKDFTKLMKWVVKVLEDKLLSKGRTSFSISEYDKISINLIKNNFLIAHYNAADLSMLSDFNKLKEGLSIVGKSFVTLSKPLKIVGVNVYIRDTHLLTPAGSKGLAALGKLYESEGGVSKVNITKDDLEHMDEFLIRDPQAFEAYAITDAIIPLIHSITLEKVNFSIKRIGVPLTISSLGRSLVLEKWNEQHEKHYPYQISGDCLMGNAHEVQTPKGLFATGEVGLYLNHYVANYKGGRNESFMYGCDQKSLWYDYDLVSAYTTGMTHLALPDYARGGSIESAKVMNLSSEELLLGYYILNCSFKFPEGVKYPSIPCYIDKSTTVYPLQGKAMLTGPEFLLARNQNCEIKIKSAFYIPPLVKESKRVGVIKIEETVKPFQAIIHELQSKRKEHPKGHILNALYKELGNSIYGNIVRGMGNKLTFNTKTNDMLRVNGTELSNPILASWSTAFIRSVIGECLDNIKRLGGKVVSVTTDGFITDVFNLEDRLGELSEDRTPLLNKFKLLRGELNENSDNLTALELKNKSRGIISYSTRGQLGLEKGIKATTGFQSYGYTQDELVSIFKEGLRQKEKEFEYTQSRTRSSKDVYKKGGHVTLQHKDQKVRLLYDNRRNIVEPKDFDSHDMSECFFDTTPFTTIHESIYRRFLSKFKFKKPYLLTSPCRVARSSYRSYVEIATRTFIKGYLAESPCFGLRGDEFPNYKSIISFIKGFDLTKGMKITKQSLSNLKHRKIILRPVPKTREVIALITEIKKIIPHFDETTFIKL